MTKTIWRLFNTIFIDSNNWLGNMALAQREARENESAINDSRVQHRSYVLQETGETIPLCRICTVQL